jgi:HK97 family phage portal protein
MAWFDYFLGTTETKSNDDVLRDLLSGSNSKSGQSVTLTSALEVPVVLGIARVIAEGVAQVPWKLYQRIGEGRIEARDHPLFYLLHRRPNEWQTSFEFREQIMLHLVLAGNAFVFVNRSSNGSIIELLPYEPGSVTVKRRDDMSMEYRIRLANGSDVVIPRQNMWHVRGPSWNGYLGLDAVKQARNAIGMSMAMEEFGSALFANGARPGGLISTEQPLKAEQVKAIKDQWASAQAGSGNAMKTALLHSGLKYQPLSWNADEAQFIEAQKRVILNLCAAFRVNPIMVQQTEGSAAYASVEQMFLAHLVHTLMPWYERIEQSAEIGLLTEAERKAGFYTKLEAKGLMRGTAKERAEYMQIMRQNGVITANEWRDYEEMDRSTDPRADQLEPAANLFGNQPG